MTKKPALLIVGIFVGLAAVLCACTGQAPATQMREMPGGMEVYGFSGETAYLNDFYDRTYECSKMDLSTGEVTDIGTIKNFMMGSGDKLFLNDCIYFYLCHTEGEVFYNVLHEIDTRTDTMREVYRDAGRYAGLRPFIYRGGIASQKSYLEDGVFHSYVEVYDLDSGQVDSLLPHAVPSVNGERGTGKAIEYAYASPDDTLYLLVGQYEDGVGRYTLEAYDPQLALLQTVSLDNLADYMDFYQIQDVRIDAPFVYMRDFSGYAFMGAIEDEVIRPLIQEHELSYADKKAAWPDLFYIAYGTTFYEVEGTEVEAFDISLREELFMYNALADGDDLLLFFTDHENPGPRQMARLSRAQLRDFKLR